MNLLLSSRGAQRRGDPSSVPHGVPPSAGSRCNERDVVSRAVGEIRVAGATPLRGGTNPVDGYDATRLAMTMRLGLGLGLNPRIPPRSPRRLLIPAH